MLDAGAYGVIVPLINNRAEAEKAVSACRYPPQGMRSFGPVRAAMYGGGNYAGEANNEIACIAMIETAEGIENIENIENYDILRFFFLISWPRIRVCNKQPLINTRPK